MKFWQLLSIAREEKNGHELILRIASTRPNWKRYEWLVGNFSSLVDAQDRDALDSIVDTDFVVAVLGEIRQNLYLSSDNWLRSWQFNPEDQVISVLDAFTRYGTDAVDEAFEKGSICVDDDKGLAPQ